MDYELAGRLFTPGNPTAIIHGCKCKPEMNNGGDGLGHKGRKYYWVPSDCPLHSQTRRMLKVYRNQPPTPASAEKDASK